IGLGRCARTPRIRPALPLSSQLNGHNVSGVRTAPAHSEHGQRIALRARPASCVCGRAARRSLSRMARHGEGDDAAQRRPRHLHADGGEEVCVPGTTAQHLRSAAIPGERKRCDLVLRRGGWLFYRRLPPVRGRRRTKTLSCTRANGVRSGSAYFRNSVMVLLPSGEGTLRTCMPSILVLRQKPGWLRCTAASSSVTTKRAAKVKTVEDGVRRTRSAPGGTPPLLRPRRAGR
ncbi:hypothetical protein BD413DRAFT_598016, partial [Trametes elegans]